MIPQAGRLTPPDGELSPAAPGEAGSAVKVRNLVVAALPGGGRRIGEELICGNGLQMLGFLPVGSRQWFARCHRIADGWRIGRRPPAVRPRSRAACTYDRIHGQVLF
jgi:hypothetical protein